MLKIGDIAPDFSLFDQDKNRVSLSDYFGKKSVVIFFYPKDDTPGCTAESCAFRDLRSEFASCGAEILGVSEDDSTSHQAFISKYRLNYPLLTDIKGEVATLFGVRKSFGLFAGRATFVVDINGVIRMAYSSHINIQKHTDEALATVKVLQSSMPEPQTSA